MTKRDSILTVIVTTDYLAQWGYVISDKWAAALDEMIFAGKFNPHHEPAGSSIGGQFAEHTGPEHGGGGAGEKINIAISKTEAYMRDKGIEDRDVFVDKEAELISQRKEPEDLRKILGNPIRTEYLVQNEIGSPYKLDNLLEEALERKAEVYESLDTVLKREIEGSIFEDVKLSEITFSQEYVFEKPLINYVNSKEYTEDLLYIIENEGVMYVHDNNHRFLSAILNNEDTLRVKVVRITDDQLQSNRS